MKTPSWLCGLLLTGGLLSVSPIEAMQPAPKVFGERYHAVPAVVNQLAQVVYYRATGLAHASPANVYVDGRYHTSLLPGGFTSFCLRAGTHSLGAFINDPQYLGKTEGRYVADLQGGKTYYMRVNEQQQLHQPPLAVRQQQSEPELKQTQRQIHTRSRATALVPCVYDRAASQPESLYLFTDSDLFTQQGAITALSDGGLSALNDMVIAVRQQHPMLHSVVLRMPAQGDEAGKLKAIRNALMLAAIPGAIIRVEPLQCDKNCPTENPSIQILVR